MAERRIPPEAPIPDVIPEGADAFPAPDTAAALARDTREIGEISPAALSARLRRHEPLQLIDVREPEEWAVAHIAGARSMPLTTLPSALLELDAERETVVYCQHGTRGRAAALYLSAVAGFARVLNLAGGLSAWP